jgi:hypothetical protein
MGSPNMPGVTGKKWEGRDDMLNVADGLDNSDRTKQE